MSDVPSIPIRDGLSKLESHEVAAIERLIADWDGTGTPYSAFQSVLMPAREQDGK